MDIKIDFVVKLGGSAVTKKSEKETANLDNIKIAAKTLFESWKNGKKFIIVHGAGSFGHQLARRYKVKEGWNNLEETERNKVKTGFSLTRISVCKLNAMIAKELCDVGLPIITQSPCGSWEVNDNTKVTLHSCDSLKLLISNGFIPLLHGDCVFDSLRGCTILSGDTILQVLSKYFRPELVIFASDTTGIYNVPPSFPESKLLPRIDVDSSGEISIPIQCSRDMENDVTGGMKLKISTAVKIIMESGGSIPVAFCGLSHKAFFNVSVYGDYDIKNECTVIKHIDFKGNCV